jgi:hypothetical protein
MRAVVTAGIAVGLVERGVMWRSKIGAIDADEAVWGLMSRHIAHGELTAFMWGQGYGGVLESVLSAPILVLFPGSTLALRAVPLALTALAAILVWRVGLRTVGEPAAAAAAVLFWLWPSYAIWKSMRAHGFYATGIVAALLVLLLVLRLDARSSRRDAAMFGLVVGLGLWQSAQLLPIAATATVWLLWRSPASVRLVPVALPCAFVGFLPWIVSNVQHDWWSFSYPPGYGTFLSRLRGSVDGALPMSFGLRIPFDLSWVGGIAIGGTLMIALYVGLVVLVWRRWRTTLSLLLAVAVVFPFLAATSTFTWISDEPRYFYVVSPVFALLVSTLLTTWWRAAIGIAIATAITALGLARMNSSPAFGEQADGMFVPRSFAPLVRELDRRGVRDVYADYWIAYRLDFMTDERIVAAESPQENYVRRGGKVVVLDEDHVRYPRYRAEVTASARPAHVVLTGSVDEKKVDAPLLRAAGYRRTAVGGFTVWWLPPVPLQ